MLNKKIEFQLLNYFLALYPGHTLPVLLRNSLVSKIDVPSSKRANPRLLLGFDRPWEAVKRDQL
jgi:hypothetical protein